MCVCVCIQCTHVNSRTQKRRDAVVWYRCNTRVTARQAQSRGIALVHQDALSQSCLSGANADTSSAIISSAARCASRTTACILGDAGNLLLVLPRTRYQRASRLWYQLLQFRIPQKQEGKQKLLQFRIPQNKEWPRGFVLRVGFCSRQRTAEPLSPGCP